MFMPLYPTFFQPGMSLCPFLLRTLSIPAPQAHSHWELSGLPDSSAKAPWPFTYSSVSSQQKLLRICSLCIRREPELTDPLCGLWFLNTMYWIFQVLPFWTHSRIALPFSSEAKHGDVTLFAEKLEWKPHLSLQEGSSKASTGCAPSFPSLLPWPHRLSAGGWGPLGPRP